MGQKNIKIKIADRVYPLSISEKEEGNVMTSEKKIEENITKLRSKYKITDSQDLLAMTCLEFATKVQNTLPVNPNPKEEYSSKLDDILTQLDEALS